MEKISISKTLFSEKKTWEIAVLASLMLCLLFSQISISIVQIFLTLAFLSWIILLVQHNRRLAFPAFFWPLLAYAALSVISSALSVNPGMSFKDSRELLLYVLVPIVYTSFRKKEEFDMALFALYGSALINSIYSLGYYLFSAYPAERVKGFMGHYMTQAGLLALFGSFALGMIFFKRGKTKIFWMAVLAPVAIALLLTLTRSAWIGLAFALCVILLVWRPKTLVLVPILAGLVFTVSPQAIKNRALSIFSLRGYSNMARVEYLKTGAKIIKDFPLFGTGPDTVDIVFQNPKYGLGEIARKNVHLHNNFIQIAAERGIFAFLAWLTFLVTAFIALIKLLKRKENGVTAWAAGALASLTALTASGIFEYNFGDSEITMLLLFIITAPFALERIQRRERT
jgi:O-antigen ligase